MRASVIPHFVLFHLRGEGTDGDTQLLAAGRASLRAGGLRRSSAVRLRASAGGGFFQCPERSRASQGHRRASPDPARQLPVARCARSTGSLKLAMLTGSRRRGQAFDADRARDSGDLDGFFACFDLSGTLEEAAARATRVVERLKIAEASSAQRRAPGRRGVGYLRPYPRREDERARNRGIRSRACSAGGGLRGSIARMLNFSGMSTIGEIEAAIKNLPLPQVEELASG